MEYRKFGKTDISPSILGFGMMRMKRNEEKKYDEAWSVETLRYAIDHGLTYVDTAYMYGDSERITGVCLQDGYREKVTLATKLPVTKLTCEEDFEKILDTELERLQTDHIDVYLLHALNRDRWENYVKKFNVLAHAEQARAAGKIRYLGFSFHDNFETFETILNGHDRWDMCQIQLNYMDTHYQAGLAGLQLAHEKGLAVVIMEPLRGGVIAKVPEEVAALLPKNPVESALDFLWNDPRINVVLSGMSEAEQVQENLLYASRAYAGMLTEEENRSILKAGDLLREKLNIPCTACGYCSLCPKQVAIPEIFKIYNQRRSDGDTFKAVASLKALGEHNATACVACGACVKECPQQINIPDKLASISKELL